MREIKFRYWYGDKVKTMVSVGRLDFYVDGEIIVNDELVGGVLMQFTGLKDKNGVEIFEGDIVIYPNPKIKRIVEFGNDIPIEVDEYTQKITGFYLREIGSIGSQLYSLTGDTFEVIGNIYENPELIEG